MKEHLTNTTHTRAVLLPAFVTAIVLVAATFLGVRAETTLEMMDVSDRLPAFQSPGADVKSSPYACDGSKHSNPKKAGRDEFISSGLQQPESIQIVPHEAATVDSHSAQSPSADTKKAHPDGSLSIAQAPQREGVFFIAAGLRQPEMTQFQVNSNETAGARSGQTQSADSKNSSTGNARDSRPSPRDSVFIAEDLRQPETIQYPLPIATSEGSHAAPAQSASTPIAKQTIPATPTSAPSQKETIASSGLKQPDLSPLYSVATSDPSASQAKQTDSPIAKLTEPLSAVSTPAYSDACIADSLKQPGVSQFPIYSAAPVEATAPLSRRPDAPVAIRSEPVAAISVPSRGEANAAGDLKQPDLSPTYAVAAEEPTAAHAQSAAEKFTKVADAPVTPVPVSTPIAAIAKTTQREPIQAPLYSAAPARPFTAQSQHLDAPAATPSEPVAAISAPSYVDAYASTNLKQPDLTILNSAADTETHTGRVQPDVTPISDDTPSAIHGQFAVSKLPATYYAASAATAAEIPSAGDAPTASPNSPVPGRACCPQCGCAYGPGQSGAPCICGVDCGACGAPCCATWRDAKCIPWSLFGPGEYVGPARTEHVSTYYLRVNDLIKLTYITSHTKVSEQYRIRVGDRLRIEWLRLESGKDQSLDRDMLVQPDGTVTLPLIGQVAASGKTVEAFREDVVKLFSHYQKEPQITITPIEVNTDLQDILRAVTSVSGSNGQSQDLRVTPEGTIQASGIGSVFVQGLTLDELRSELEARYAATFGPGLIVSPSLTERATSYVFVGGEVRNPGRFILEGPTTVMQVIAMAGSWNVGGNTRQVVVFRRDENWCLKATKINLHAPLYGQDPCPVNDTWLRDNDLVIVPKERILCADDVINLYFTRGAYSVFPITFVKDFSTGSAITPVP